MKFEIGEIAIIARSPTFPAAIGSECRIMATNVRDNNDNLLDYGIYLKELPSPVGEGFWGVNEDDLRKKEDYDDEGSWNKVSSITGWSPSDAE